MHKPQPKPWILDIHPYIPGRSTSDDGRAMIKLSSNENPVGTSNAARTAFAIEMSSLERYPDAGAVALRDAIAAHYRLQADRIIYGNGSDEVLHLIAGAYAGPGDEVIYVNYGFSVYEIATRRVGAVPVIAADRDYATDVDAILAAVTDRTRIVFVANPNNPTGTFTSRDEIARLHTGLPGHVMLVIDQAYAEYIAKGDDDHALKLARSQPNVIVTRTFSKIFGLASERIGWGYGSAEAVDAMHRIRLPFSITSAGQVAAIAALDDTHFVEQCRKQNNIVRLWFTREIAKLGNAGLRAIPSKANFVLILFEGQLTAEKAYKSLMDYGFIVRWLPGQGLPHGLRMTMGTSADMQGLIKALRQIIEDET